MNPIIAQAGGGGGGDRPVIDFPTVDWSTLVPQLVNYFFDAIGKQVNDTLHTSFDGMWGSSLNVVGRTDLAMTWGFGPVGDQVEALQGAARVVLVFALIVLGLRGMLSGIVPRQPDMFAEFINGVVAAVIMIAAFPLLVPQLINFTNQAAGAIGQIDLSRYLSTGGVSNPMIQAVLFIILLFFAARLLMKAVWRIGFLAVLLPVGMLACALYALPQTRWLLTWWVRVWGGMLLAQIPSVFALTIGAQLFAFGAGIGAFVYSIAFLQLATDLYTLIPFGSTASGEPPWALAWPAHILVGHGRSAAGVIGGMGAGLAGVVPGMSSRGVGQTYGYQ